MFILFFLFQGLNFILLGDSATPSGLGDHVGILNNKEHPSRFDDLSDDDDEEEEEEEEEESDEEQSLEDESDKD